MTEFPFDDLHGFKDFVSYALLYLPDRFPPRAGYGPGQQWTFDLVFEGLRLGLKMAVEEKGDQQIFAECRRLIEEARAAYRAGRPQDGMMKLHEVSCLLDNIPTC